ncbi:hypothetical protein QQZ08_011558 [Neonectria magnoliae]|uniref:Uncharacterized protein n=1 Tax=Neonectria magnoliae TaxID=2732573 RepID=A0ABR1H969_9HYPO
MARQSPEERAAQAAELSARQIRRFYEKGGNEIDSALLPLIYKLAPSLDFLSDDEEDHPQSWKKDKKFKNAVKNFRSQAEKIGHTVPAASDDWVSFDPSRPIPLTNESSDENPEAASRQPTVPSTSSNTIHAKVEGEPMDGVEEATPVPQASRDPSSAPTDVPATSTAGSSAPRQTTPISISSASSSPTPSASTGTPAASTRGSTAPPQPSVETPPREQPNALAEKFWPRFKALVPRPNDSPGWRVLEQECLLYGCDFADVMFRCEFRLKHEVNDNADGLRAFAADWIRICPEALDFLDGDCHGDSTMKGHISAWRSQHPRQIPQRRERDLGSRYRLFSEDPEQDR